MVSNSGGVTNLSESFEVLRLSAMQSFGFTNVESSNRLCIQSLISASG